MDRTMEATIYVASRVWGGMSGVEDKILLVVLT